jgi:hypothetical protein
MSDDLMRYLATWALLHELADDAWKEAVERGRDGVPGMEGGKDAFLDGLAAAVAEEKDRLRTALSEGSGEDTKAATAEAIEEVRFEVGELRSRLESMETTLDAIARRLGEGGAVD